MNYSKGIEEFSFPRVLSGLDFTPSSTKSAKELMQDSIKREMKDVKAERLHPIPADSFGK